MLIKLGKRQVKLSIWQVICHVVLIVAAWWLFAYLVRESIRIEKLYFFQLGLWAVLFLLALMFGWIAFVMYFFRRKERKRTLVDFSALADRQEESTDESDELKRMKFIEIE